MLAAAVVAMAAGCDEPSSGPVSAGDAATSGADTRTGGADTGRNADAIGTPDARATAEVGPGRDAGAALGRSADADATDSRGGADRGRGGDTGGSPDAKITADGGLPPEDAGADGSGTNPDPCAGGTTLADSTTTRVEDYGWVRLLVPTDNQIVELTTTMVVPDKPPASGTLFLWPGLQPLRGAANFSALDNGVLQPVLTWGPTCAPYAPAQSYASWWISGEYVNTNISTSSPNYAAYHDCHGGPGMNVTPGDTLDMRFALNGTDWTQTVINRRNAQSVSYTINMLGQAQASAEFVIEEYDSKPLADVIFTSSVITFASPAKSACQPYQRGANDYFTSPRVSADGLRCCIDKVTLRSQGVAATTANSP